MLPGWQKKRTSEDNEAETKESDQMSDLALQPLWGKDVSDWRFGRNNEAANEPVVKVGRPLTDDRRGGKELRSMQRGWFRNSLSSLWPGAQEPLPQTLNHLRLRNSEGGGSAFAAHHARVSASSVSLRAPALITQLSACSLWETEA